MKDHDCGVVRQRAGKSVTTPGDVPKLPRQRRLRFNLKRSCSSRVMAAYSTGHAMAELSQARIREIYEDFASCRLERLSEVFDKDIVFLSHAPTDIFPYLLTRAANT